MRAQGLPVGIVGAVAAEFDRRRRRSAATRAAPCRAWSCPSRIRRRCRASRRAAAAAWRARTASIRRFVNQPRASWNSTSTPRAESSTGASSAIGATRALRPAREQAPRVRMLRVREHLGGRPDLDQPAALHHADAVREAAHEVQVVGDEEQRHAELGLQLVEKREDLGLDRDVERRRRLVGDEQAGAGRRAPSRSSRAGAGRPRAGADRRRRGARGRGCRSRSSSSIARARAACGRSASCSSSTSAIWLPTV